MALQMAMTGEDRARPPVSVRDAVAGDAAQIARFGPTAFAAAHEGLAPATAIETVVAETYAEPALRHCIARCADAPDAHFLVAEQEDRLLGFLHFDSFGERPELHRIYVERAATGRGIGAALIRELELRLPARTTYILLVVEANERAVAFYRREGFHEERREADGLPLYGLHMQLGLPQNAPLPILVFRKTVG